MDVVYAKRATNVARNKIPRSLAACGTAPLLAVAVPALGIYGEDSNRKLQFVGFEPNSCPFRRWPFLFLQQFV